MRTGIVAFLMGNIALLYWPYLPDQSTTLVSLFIIFILLFLLYKVHHKIVSPGSAFYYFCLLALSVFSGAVYTSLYIHFNVKHLELKQWEGETIRVIGTVDSIPYSTETKQTFNFKIKARKTTEKKEQWDHSFQAKVKLS
ncbi:MAG: DUF4131 domain-containing protein [gamma proteobacterium symbiont of Taylorina sp.]|nr:DUF4131 domain-containing protein [gamma proteobacterium symbiont of Taylorina sp.]